LFEIKENCFPRNQQTSFQIFKYFFQVEHRDTFLMCRPPVKKLHTIVTIVQHHLKYNTYYLNKYNTYCEQILVDIFFNVEFLFLKLCKITVNIVKIKKAAMEVHHIAA